LFPDRTRVLHVFSGKVDTAVMLGGSVDSNPAMALTWPQGRWPVATLFVGPSIPHVGRHHIAG
jgi:hypothetical protein